MPLFKVEVREKQLDAVDTPAARSSRPAPRRSAESRRDSGLLAIIAGAFSALLILAGLASWLVSRYGAPVPSAADPNAPSVPAVVDVGNVAELAGNAPPADAYLTAAQLPPINPDFPRDATIASVGVRAFSMAQLEEAARLSRAMGLLAGDPVPSYDDGPGMALFQVNLLRRQVDVMLMEQAAEAAGTAAEMPVIPNEELLADFLGKVGADRRQLDDMLAANGVGIAHLMDFLRRTQLLDFFVQSELMDGRPQEERDQVVREWIDNQWATSSIRIQFYDPDSLPGAAP